MNEKLRTLLITLANPFVEKKIHEYKSTNNFDKPKPHTAQLSTQIGTTGVLLSLAALTHVDSQESIIACVISLLVNLALIYLPKNLPFKKS